MTARKENHDWLALTVEAPLSPSRCPTTVLVPRTGCSCGTIPGRVALLAPRGLTFEAWCHHRQILDVAALARAFPDTTIILDHFGGPAGIGS